VDSVASNSLSSDVSVTEVSSFTSDTDVIPGQTENRILTDVDTHMSLLDEHISRSQQPCEEAVDMTTDVAEHVGFNNLTETDAKCDKTGPAVPMLCCSNCGQQVPQLNFQLHSLHCKTSAAKSSGKKSKDVSLNKVMCLASSCNSS